ncbi:MAG: hypothetical protein QM486_05940 [Flavobacteriaceae bacterium]
MSDKQKLYLKIGIIIPVIGLLLTAFYRPYIYSHDINDFGFAAVIGSLVSVIGFCCFVWGFKSFSNKEMNAQIILAIFIFSFLWEFFGYLGIYGVFDWKDVVAGILSGLFTFFIKQLVERKFRIL